MMMSVFYSVVVAVRACAGHESRTGMRQRQQRAEEAATTSSETV